MQGACRGGFAWRKCASRLEKWAKRANGPATMGWRPVTMRNGVATFAQVVGQRPSDYALPNVIDYALPKVRRISAAAFAPGPPVTPPPGWVPAPQR